MLDLTTKKVLVTGAHGFLGQHIVTELHNRGVTAISTPTLEEINLLSFKGCEQAVAGQDIIIHAAGKVGGIGANRRQPGSFFYENALMGMQLLEAARLAQVTKFIQIGTVCSYPEILPQVPYREKDLWNGYPEEINGPYGLAKKMLLVQGQAYRTQYKMNVIHLLQVNLYGPGDHFGSADSHVIPALIDRFWKAKQENKPEVIVWGSGHVTRDFLYAPDAATGIILATQHYNGKEPVNLSSGREISIDDVAEKIAHLIGYTGKITWDTSKPDGQLRRLFDPTTAQQQFGFTAPTPFAEGLAQTIAWYQKHCHADNTLTMAA